MRKRPKVTITFDDLLRQKLMVMSERSFYGIPLSRMVELACANLVKEYEEKNGPIPLTTSD